MKVNVKTRVDAIYEMIRERICVGTYQDGDVLHEGALGREFMVSRTPIRQVLQRLAYEKLAIVRPGVGTIVGGLHEEDVEKCIQVKSRIQSIIADLNIVQAPAEIVDEFDSLSLRASRLGEQPELDKVWNLARDLHTFCNRLIEDDLLEHADDMLFYRTAPALYEGIREAPERAAEFLKSEITKLAVFVESGNFDDLFSSRAQSVLNYNELLRFPAERPVK